MVSFLSVIGGLEVCDKRIKAGVRSGDSARNHAGLDNVIGIVVRKVEAEKAGFAEDGNDFALLAEDRLIGERIGESESEAVIILKGTKHFVRRNDFDPGAGVIAGEERGHEESPTLEELVKRNRWGRYGVGGLIGKGIVGVLDFGDVFIGDMEGAGIIGPDGDAVAVIFVDSAGEKGDLKFSFQGIVIRADNWVYGMEFYP